MDGIVVEPGNRVHENQRGVRALLCRTHGAASARHGPAQLPQRIRSDLSPRHARTAAEVEEVHKAVPAEFIGEIFFTMNQARWHTFQILTKRADRLRQLAPRLKWTSNIWMGVTVENDRHVDRIDWLRKVPAAVRFLSLEPLLGPLPELDLSLIDWVIVGGESGPGARPMDPAWVLELRDQCQNAGVAFFFKQWGGVRKKKAGRLLEKRTWDQMPRETAML